MNRPREKIRIQIERGDVIFYKTHLLISENRSLDYLKSLFLEIQTVSEGTKLFQMEDVYEKTELFEPKGERYHFFSLKVRHLIEVRNITFWCVKEGEEVVIGKEMSYI